MIFIKHCVHIDNVGSLSANCHTQLFEINQQLIFDVILSNRLLQFENQINFINIIDKKLWWSQTEHLIVQQAKSSNYIYRMQSLKNIERMKNTIDKGKLAEIMDKSFKLIIKDSIINVRIHLLKSVVGLKESVAQTDYEKWRLMLKDEYKEMNDTDIQYYLHALN